MKPSRQCLISYSDPFNLVKNTPLRDVFLTLFSTFGYREETLSLVFDKVPGTGCTRANFVCLKDFQFSARKKKW